MSDVQLVKLKTNNVDVASDELAPPKVKGVKLCDAGVLAPVCLTVCLCAGCLRRGELPPQ